MISRTVARVVSFCCAVAVVLTLGAPSWGAAKRSFHVSLPDDPAVIAPGSLEDRIEVSGAGWKLDQTPGAARLPYRIVRVVLPQGEEVEGFTFSLHARTTAKERFRIPTAGALESSDGGAVPAPARRAIESDATARVEFLGSGILHGYRIASFAVFPFEVRDGVLYRAGDADIEVATRPATSLATERRRHRDGWRERVRERLASSVINPGDLDTYAFGDVVVPSPEGGFQPTSFPSLEGSPVDYVIVTNDSLAASYQVLADWKTKKGVPTVVRTTEWIAANYRNGSDLAETVRSFVADAYALWGIQYVLIGGDTEQIPARYAFSGFFDGGRNLPADMYFGCLDGDWNTDHDAVFGEYGEDDTDLYSEVYVGRLPTRSNAEASLMITKVTNYELPAHLGYGKKILLLGEVLFPTDYDPGETITLNGADIAEYVRGSWLTDPALDVLRM